MMTRSRANEIPELVRRLGSRSQTRVDAARARLSIIGERAVEDLIEALEGDNNRIRANAMPLLAVIQDLRAREPLTAILLLDRSARMRETAARSLGRFSCQNSVRALNRVLERERNDEVKIASVQSLVEHYLAGRDEAIGGLLHLLVDEREPSRVRLAAFTLLRALPPAQRRGILARLKQDPQDEIRDKAFEVEAALTNPAEPTNGEIERLIQDLASDDYAAWNEAVQRLGAYGTPVVQPLIAEMRLRAHDPEYCTRAGMALKALGPRRARSLADALDGVREPLPLQVLVEVIGALGEKSMIYRLKELIERVASESSPNGASGTLDAFQRVRAKAHLELARIGSRVAIQDLRQSLSDSGPRIELELLAAVALVGKREELAILLRAYDCEDEFVRGRIAGVVREIMKRERIRRNARLLQNLPGDQREALERILARTRPVSRRKPRAERPRV